MGVAFAVALALALAGCTAAPAPVSSPTTSVTSAAPTVSAAAPSAPSPSAPTATVPANPQTTASPLALDRSYQAGKVRVELAALKAVNAKGEGPGEISGPALAVSVRIINGTTKNLDVSHVIVNLLDSKGNVATPLSPSAPFSGSIAAGDSAKGTYEFSIAKNVRKPVKVSVTYDLDQPTALFVGNV